MTEKQLIKLNGKRVRILFKVPVRKRGSLSLCSYRTKVIEGVVKIEEYTNLVYRLSERHHVLRHRAIIGDFVLDYCELKYVASCEVIG